MNFTINKTTLLSIIFISIGIFLLSFNSDDASIPVQTREDRDDFVVSGIDKKAKVQAVIVPSANAPAVLKEKMSSQKQRIKEELQEKEKLLQSTKTYSQNIAQKRGSYLNYMAKYSTQRSNIVGQKIKAIKTDKEREYQHKLMQQNQGRVYSSKAMGQIDSTKRVALNQTRFKSVENIRNRELLNQKYHKGE